MLSGWCGSDSIHDSSAACSFPTYNALSYPVRLASRTSAKLEETNHSFTVLLVLCVSTKLLFKYDPPIHTYNDSKDLSYKLHSNMFQWWPPPSSGQSTSTHQNTIIVSLSYGHKVRFTWRIHRISLLTQACSTLEAR